MKRVLVACAEAPPLVGGIGTIVDTVVRELVTRERFEVHLFCPEGTETARGVVLHPCFRRSGSILTRYLLNALDLRRVVRAQRFDAVLFMDPAVRMLAFPFVPRVRSLAYVHGTEVASRGRAADLVSVRMQLQRHGLQRVDRVLAVSRSTARRTSRAVPGCDVGVVNPCFDPRRAYDPARHTDPYADFSPDTLKLVTIARVVERKGQDTVLRLLAHLRNRLPPFRYVIVGDGPYLPALRTLAQQLGLADHVVFAGRKTGDEVAAYYRHADLFVMMSRPSKTEGVEGFPMSLVEAGLCGCPVVGSTVGGVDEVIEHGRTGLTLDPHRFEETAEALLALALDPARRRRFGETARARMLELSPKRVVDRLLHEVGLAEERDPTPAPRG